MKPHKLHTNPCLQNTKNKHPPRATPKDCDCSSVQGPGSLLRTTFHRPAIGTWERKEGQGFKVIFSCIVSYSSMCFQKTTAELYAGQAPPSGHPQSLGHKLAQRGSLGDTATHSTTGAKPVAKCSPLGVPGLRCGPRPCPHGRSAPGRPSWLGRAHWLRLTPRQTTL